MNKAKLHRIFQNMEMNPRDRKDLVNELSKGGSGGGIQIVDSIDKLDPNAKAGSLASVVEKGSIQYIDLTEIKEFSTENINPDYSINADNLIKINSIEIIPNVISDINVLNYLHSTMDNLGFAKKGASLMSQDDTLMIYVDIDSFGEEEEFKCYATVNGKDYLLYRYMFDLDGNLIPNSLIKENSNIKIVNDFFVDSEVYCLGNVGRTNIDDVTTEPIYFASFNSIVKLCAGIPDKTYIYYKDTSWKELYKNELVTLFSNIEDINSNKENKIKYLPNSINLKRKPNEYFVYDINSSNYGSLRFTLLPPEEDMYWYEYNIEINCIVGPITDLVIKDEDNNEITLKWNNGIAPVFETGYRYIISIDRNYNAVFGQFEL